MVWLTPLLAENPPCDGLQRLELDIQGIQCGACVWLIEQLFRRQPGGSSIDVNPGRGRMQIVFELGVFRLEEWLHDLEALSYRAGPPRRGSEKGDDLLLRLGLCSAIAMNGMILSISHYFGLTAESDAQLFQLFGWVNLGLSTLAVMIGGSVFIRGAFQAALRELGESEREAFLLKETRGLTYAEVGRIMSLHPDAARRRVAKATAQLKTLLAEGSTP